MSESFRLTCCCHGVAPESKLSRTPRQHHSFHGNADIIRGKNIKNMSCGKTGVKSLIVQVLKCSSNYQSNQTSSARFTLEDQFFMFFSSINSSRKLNKKLNKKIIKGFAQRLFL